jgi:hypothetical protein
MVLALALSALLSQAVPGELTVYVFTTTDCPISNRYAPEIQRLAAKFATRVKFVLVYPVPTDTPQMIDAHRAKFGYQLPFVRDLKQQLVKQTGVTVTPEVAVMRGGRRLYRGRIDDRYIEFGRDRPVPTTHDLEDALEAILAGRPVAQPETRAVGCILSDLVQ